MPPVLGPCRCTRPCQGTPNVQETPDERLHAAYAEIRQSVRDELLGLVRAADPYFFERLVLDLLHAMGYGAKRDDLVQAGGIDGVISLDRLGLEKVYVQAKRYADDHPISLVGIDSDYFEGS